MTKKPQPIGILEQNRLVDGISISVSSIHPDAPGKTTVSLSDFLRRFETPKQRAMVRTAVHAALRASQG